MDILNADGVRTGVLRFPLRVGVWRRVLDRLTGTQGDGDTDDLIASLNQVAAAVSSSLSVDDVLQTIVDRTKRITDTDKAVMLLTQDHSAELDLDTLVVRGIRADHPQEAWQDQLGYVAQRAFATGELVLTADGSKQRWLLASPIKITDRPVGLLVAINSRDRAFTRQQMRFLSILSAFAASAIENARLAEEHRYVLLAGERDRIAREMHDGVVQSLFSISLGLELCKKLVKRDPNAVAGRLTELQEHLNNSMTELRRFIYDLRPMKLQELGIAGGIDYWISEVTTGRPIRGRLVVEGEARVLSPEVEVCLYRIAKEATTNVIRHAAATEFEVRLRYAPTGVAMRISDNGRGFIAKDGLELGEEIGLRSMRERVSRLGGRITIESELEHGTRIDVEL